MKRKVIGMAAAAAVILGAGALGSTWSAELAEAAGGSWFDTNVFQRGCRAHQPDCAHNWVP